MINGKRIIAIIPARGGSKGIPNKNIIDLCGKPLIAYSVEEAKKSKYIDRVIVSTDSLKIKEVSLNYGAEVPFIRSEELSSDSAKSIDVVIDCLQRLEDTYDLYDYVVLLQPTSPLRMCEDIDSAIERIVEFKSKSLVSMCEAYQNPILMRTIEKDRMFKIVDCNKSNLRRQELPKFYIFNGAIYISSVEMIYSERAFVNDDTIPFIMDKERSIDIDEPKDIVLAEYFLKRRSYI
ncbi:CMP-N,N'-diacetyllegionaminic acid synthase [Clostridium tepidiprofundi DSM 19306]|uniref:CMP-N,N'-diacetyllegionaminic acid synthase n=1 Tax=Clostridium tepidiprofundi DSM 19306 TaxID=1121338 RepID=A0A151B5E8_9CLOT|nr:acylneuraminate cytidylyltransferase family protein [Clostridium tepidiprofundi]KYH35144.1 CMP-N,N'-diacetyllegionaminic acid synthase [Clostridium tepidiprofundi DSM 19306]